MEAAVNTAEEDLDFWDALWPWDARRNNPLVSWGCDLGRKHHNPGCAQPGSLQGEVFSL